MRVARATELGVGGFQSGRAVGRGVPARRLLARGAARRPAARGGCRERSRGRGGWEGAGVRRVARLEGVFRRARCAARMKTDIATRADIDALMVRFYSQALTRPACGRGAT